MGRKYLLWGVLAAVLGSLVSCGGSGGGDSSNTTGSGALSVAEKVSVVDAQETTSASISKAKALSVDFSKAASSLPSTSAYATDATNTYVEERSADSFSRINEILCSMAQTRYTDMLNLGDYRAQIDASQCGQDKDSAKGAGQSSQNQSTGQNATEYETWTVNSSRATDQPHIVKVWMHEAASSMEPAKTMYVHVQITEGVSATNPIGIFTADFKGCMDTDPSCATPMMSGYLKSERDSSNNVLLKFYVSGGFGGFVFTEQATLNKNVDGNSGAGSVLISDTNQFEGAMSEAFNISYDATHFYRGNADGTEPVCLDRSNFSTNVWRYGLYFDENHATPGARVSRANPGFPIRFESSGQNYYGFAGYYGIFIPGDASISTGDTVYQQDFSAPGQTAEAPYTVFVANGRLKKHVKQTITLGETKNIPLSWNTCTQSGAEWQCIDNRVKWDGTQLLKDATRSQSTNWMWQNLPAPVPVVFSQTDFSFNFWSESLGGDGRIDLMNKQTGQSLSASDLTDATVVIFNKVSTVYPGDSGIPTSLACFENCMDPSNINTQNPYFTNSTFMAGENSFNVVDMNVAPADLVAGTHYIAYSFDPVAMLLTYGGSPVVLTESSEQGNGVWGGSLFDPTSAANLATLGCDWDPTNQTCTWQVWDLDTFYTWETGAQEWNKLTALKDANNQYVSFDPPLMLEYSRASTGAKYFLEYNGFGDLWGIPGKCVNADTGLEVPCFMEDDSRNIRWVPEFSITEGSTVRDVAANLTYYVKPLEQEQQMLSTDVSSCTGAGLSLTSYTLPDASLVTDPGIGSEPTVTDAPAVIGGVLQ